MEEPRVAGPATAAAAAAAPISATATATRQEASLPPDQLLKKLTAENARLRQEAESSSHIMPVSAACEDLIKFINSVPDPFLVTWDHVKKPNPWITGPKLDRKGGCTLL
ncbi:hypothetical protein PAPYR_4966 [Paratrimastix pyriformis]|uniref:G protein gamma domain-containing protein n=1 Tax=Paratrimastix pyriformis TaxID=342808 RepID=A0ABQ8UIW3_9EUKA|nr:hypothetical protein PAPYR_4966 [Paratrimastix pyriformis]